MTANIPDACDYLIIGAGTAGLAVASRLCEQSTDSILVLEAGKDLSAESSVQIPGLGFSNIGNPIVDWGFTSTPQHTLDGRQVYLPRGKGLGGTSNVSLIFRVNFNFNGGTCKLNLMNWARAGAEEYNAMLALGNKGWTWSDLLDYFKKSETLTFSDTSKELYPSANLDPSFHGSRGPMSKRMPTMSLPLDHKFIAAMSTVGVPYNSDQANGNNIGVGVVCQAIVSEDKTTMKPAVRSSSASGYYARFKNRKNLRSITEAQVSRIVFDTTNTAKPVATGVEVIIGGKKSIVRANKEIILAAGSYQTPQILELSGVANAEHLEKLGIDVVVDLHGVGENLRKRAVAKYHLPNDLTSHLPKKKDHPFVPLTLRLDDMAPLPDMMDSVVQQKAMADYAACEPGPMSSTLATLMGCVPLSTVGPNAPAKAIALLEGEDQNKKLAGGPAAVAVYKEWLASKDVSMIGLIPVLIPFPGVVDPQPGGKYLSISTMDMHPLSRGTVHIDSTDIVTPPKIDHRFLEHTVDRHILIEGIRFARRVAKSGKLATLVKEEVWPGKEVESDEELLRCIKEKLGVVYHPVGTCAMAPREKGGVVGPDLKVYGTDHLSVVDASIMPLLYSGLPQATIYAHAEKAADLILKRTHD